MMRRVNQVPLSRRVAAFGLLGAVLGFASGPAAHAADLTASSALPTVTFDDTDHSGTEWGLSAIADVTGSFFLLVDKSGNRTVFQINSSPANGFAFHLDDNADLHLLNSTVTIERATGRLGIGTLTPDGKIDVFGFATQDVFAGFGPDLVNGPALTFGYSGSSFGRGSGFFNVRPDAGAAAPNPSLRFATANVQRMIITNIGRVGLGVPSPDFPLHLASGAHVTDGGVWTDASSREYKQDIEPLTPDEARAALAGLDPVKFTYRGAAAERHVGFVAEDVPALVATADRKGLSPMDIVAVLTRVVQEQQRLAEEQQRRAEEQQAALAALRAEVAELRRAAGR